MATAHTIHTSHTLDQQLEALRHAAGVFPLSASGNPNHDRAFLRITGSDATRWLNGMVTNNIKDLAPGEGSYNFLLNSQGRIQADCTIFRLPTAGDATFLLATSRAQLETIHQHLDHFIIMDDVELTAIENLRTVVLIGPKAPEVLRRIEHPLLDGAISFADSAPLRLHYYPQTGAQLITPTAGPIPCFEISTTLLQDAIFDAALSAGAVEVSAEALNALRILSGQPAFGIDIRDKDLPQETAQSHALHFNKGCYLGQEIVERIHSRGQVHRTFTQFKLTGLMPQFPSLLEVPSSTPGAPAKSAGELTSAVRINGELIALGYLRREFANQRLNYPGGTAIESPKPASNTSH